MKKFLLVALIAFVSFGVHAQGFDGIGKLHLDMTLNEVRALFPQKLVKQYHVSTFKKVYKLNSYTPIKGHTFRDLHLYFYNDTLYAIYVNNSTYQIEQSLFTKYGKPKDKIHRFRSYIEELISIFGYDSADFVDDKKAGKWDIIDTFYEWDLDNPFHKCLLVDCLYYDKQGESQLDYLLVIKNTAFAECVYLEEKILEREKESESIEGLEGL